MNPPAGPPSSLPESPGKGHPDVQSGGQFPALILLDLLAAFNAIDHFQVRFISSCAIPAWFPPASWAVSFLFPLLIISLSWTLGVLGRLPDSHPHLLLGELTLLKPHLYILMAAILLGPARTSFKFQALPSHTKSISAASPVSSTFKIYRPHLGTPTATSLIDQHLWPELMQQHLHCRPCFHAGPCSLFSA